MKNFNELTLEELKQVFEKNEKLRSEVFNTTQEDVNIFVRECMSCFESGSLEYNIGYPGDYMEIKDGRKFLNGLLELQKRYVYFSEEDENKIKLCSCLVFEYDHLNESEDLACVINEKIHELLTHLKDNFCELLKKEYEYYFNDENLCNFFLDIYVDCFMDSECCYIDEDFILYENIQYIKCYK